MRALVLASTLVLSCSFSLGCSASPGVPPDAPSVLDAPSALDAPSTLDGASSDSLDCGPCESACCALNSWGTPVPPYCPPTRFWECGGGPRFDAGPIDASAEPDALDRVSCGEMPPVFPAFGRSCSFHPDCVAVRHQIDCCGSFVQTGISEIFSAAFAAADAECQSEYPDCDCRAEPDVADDGTTGAPTDTATVRCVDFVCTTSFAPAP